MMQRRLRRSMLCSSRSSRTAGARSQPPSRCSSLTSVSTPTTPSNAVHCDPWIRCAMKSILLVDDEALICAEFKRTLEGFGFQVSTAHTLESALRSIRKAAFDAILLEFNLRSERRAHPTTGNSVKLVRQLRAIHV